MDLVRHAEKHYIKHHQEPDAFDRHNTGQPGHGSNLGLGAAALSPNKRAQINQPPPKFEIGVAKAQAHTGHTIAWEEVYHECDDDRPVLLFLFVPNVFPQRGIISSFVPYLARPFWLQGHDRFPYSS